MKRGTPDHWKMKDLARRLNIPPMYAICWANGCMERLWHYAARYCLQGDIGRVPDAEIAEVCGWPVKAAGRLVEALVQARWLDRSSAHRLLIHDWPEHCDESVKKTLKNRGLPFFFLESSGKIPENSSLARAEAFAFPSLSQAKPETEPYTVPARAVVEAIREPIKTLTIEAPIDFVLWWELWSSVKGTAKRQQALQAFMSLWVPSHGIEAGNTNDELMGCTRSYLESLENPAKGYNPDTFLYEQAKDGFKARWPAFRRNGNHGQRESILEKLKREDPDYAD